MVEATEFINDVAARSCEVFVPVGNLEPPARFFQNLRRQTVCKGTFCQRPLHTTPHKLVRWHRQAKLQQPNISRRVTMVNLPTSQSCLAKIAGVHSLQGP